MSEGAIVTDSRTGALGEPVGEGFVSGKSRGCADDELRASAEAALVEEKRVVPEGFQGLRQKMQEVDEMILAR